MPLYNYKAVDPDGRSVAGRIDALNIVDLEMRLRRMDLDLVDGNLVSNRNLLGARNIERRELIHFCFHLEHLVRVRVPILDGLSDLRDSMENPHFREIIASLVDNIEGGQTLSQAMEAHPKVFDKVFVSLIRAGETTGRLPEVLLARSGCASACCDPYRRDLAVHRSPGHARWHGHGAGLCGRSIRCGPPAYGLPLCQPARQPHEGAGA